MRSRRPPSLPPEIEGYEYKRIIGSGGFADVFLYQQHRPRRQVAVKVLLPQWSEGVTREAFAAEADLMAAVSGHPSIVTIFDSDVTADGRLFLAMEYCSRPNLSARYKKERLGIAETLRIGVQIAGAVETAHRSGIVHRDIKPANILVTDYGHPALTDFGISATIEQSEAGADGMSVPWSPPENLAEEPRSGPTSDVWSLAATVYTLLAGRSPFEIVGGVNNQRALIERITTEPLPPIGRGDVPASLERVLDVAMAKDPGMRYRTMLDLGRALQQVQIELNLATTPIDILEDPAGSNPVIESPSPHAADDDDGGTRMRLASDRVHPGYGVAHSPGPARPATTSGLPDGVASSLSQSHSSYGSLRGVPYVPATSGSIWADSSPRTDSSPRADSTPSGSSGYLTSAAPAAAAAAAYYASGPGATASPAPSGPTSQTGPAGPSDASAEVRYGRAPGSVRRPWIATPAGILAIVAVVLGVGGGYLVFDASRGGGVPDIDVPAPAELTATGSDNLTVFTWENPDPREGDEYAYRSRTGPDAADGAPSDIPLRQTSALTTSVSTFGVDEVCLEVVIVRDGRVSADPAIKCLV